MKTWFAINSNASPGYGAEVEIYDEIGVWGVLASDFIATVKRTKGKLLLRISSPGGSVFDAMAIYNYLRSRKDGVDVVVDGYAASAASMIMLAGEKRSMGTGAFVMVHRAMSWGIGNAEEMRKVADDLEKIEGGIKAIYSERTGKSAEEIDAWFDGEDHWMTAEESLASGFATETFEQLKAVARFDVSALSKYSAPAAVLDAFNQIQETQVMIQLLQSLGLDDKATEAAAIEAVGKLKADAQAALDLAQAQESKLTEAETKHAADMATALKDQRADIAAIADKAVSNNAASILADSIRNGDTESAVKDKIIDLMASANKPQKQNDDAPQVSYREARAAQIINQFEGK